MRLIDYTFDIFINIYWSDSLKFCFNLTNFVNYRIQRELAVVNSRDCKWFRSERPSEDRFIPIRNNFGSNRTWIQRILFLGIRFFYENFGKKYKMERPISKTWSWFLPLNLLLTVVCTVLFCVFPCVSLVNLWSQSNYVFLRLKFRSTIWNISTILNSSLFWTSFNRI